MFCLWSWDQQMMPCLLLINPAISNVQFGSLTPVRLRVQANSTKTNKKLVLTKIAPGREATKRSSFTQQQTRKIFEKLRGGPTGVGRVRSAWSSELGMLWLLQEHMYPLLGCQYRPQGWQETCPPQQPFCYYKQKQNPKPSRKQKRKAFLLPQSCSRLPEDSPYTTFRLSAAAGKKKKKVCGIQAHQHSKAEQRRVCGAEKEHKTGKSIKCIQK